MSNINTTATVNLTINGQQPIQVLQQLRQNALQLESAIARAAAAGNRTDLRRLRKELTDTRRQIREIESSTMQVESVMRRLNRATPNELNRTLQTLNRQLQYMERGSAAWNTHVAKIRQVKAEIAKLNAELRAQEGFWKRFTRTMNDWQSSIFMTAALLSGIVMAGRRAVNAYAEMEEQMANTRKYTQMAKEEVEKLNEAFKNMDTRTGRDKLNEFAQEAGRLGKNTMEDVQGYVEAADILSVALVDLGEGATQTIAKISNIFGVEQLLGTKEAMLSVGSTVNVLSQNCTASKPYLVEFAQRLAGVGAQAHMTIPEILAFGATLDANGQKVEMAASALSRTIMKLFQSPEEIAKSVGLNVQQFTETLKESTNEGLLMFLERLHEIGDKDALAALSPLFKDLGMDGIRMAQVLSVLSGKLEMVRWEQQEANKAFDEATSATREYNIFNNTAQAGIEKAKKRIHELAVELGEKLLPVYKHIMTSGSAMLRLLNMIADFVITYKNVIITVAASWAAYTLAVNASNIAFKAHYYWLTITQGAMKLLSTVTLALKIVFLALTGQIERAKAAYTAFHLLTKSTPWGIIIAAITAVGVAIYNMATATKEATKSEKELQQMNEELAETRKRYQERLDVEKRRINDLVAVARDDKASMEQRKKAIDTLNRIIPNYCGKLDAETKKYHENKKALDDYLVSLERKIRLESNRAEYERLIKEDERLTREIAMSTDMDIARVQGAVDAHSGSGRYEMKEAVAHAYGASMTVGGQITGVPDSKHVRELKGQRAAVRMQIDRLVKYAGKENLISTESTTVTEPTINDPSYTPGGGGSSGSGGHGSHSRGHSSSGRSGSGSGSQKKEDKFAAEKSWREREEALAKIDYAIGEDNYEEHTNRMLKIEEEFYRKQLAHTDLEGNERVVIESQLYEVLRKQTEEANKNSIEEEKRSYAIRKAELQQMYLENKISTEAYNEEMSRIEMEHLKNIQDIYRNQAFAPIDEWQDTKDKAEQYMLENYNGNVDLFNRPIIDAYELTKAGWKGNPEKEGEAVATVYAQQYGVKDASGQTRQILVTPILPDGTVLSEKDLKDYINSTLKGADDLLAADEKGIVIKVDAKVKDKDGNNDEVSDLNTLQLAYYAAKPEVDEKAWANFIDAEAAYQDRLVQEQIKKQQEAEEELQKHQAELKKIKDEYFGNNAVEDKQEYDKAIALLDEQYKKELEMVGDNAKEKLRIEEAYEKAKLALKKKYNQITEDDNKNFMQKFNQSAQEWLESDVGKAVTKSVEAISSAMSSLFSQLRSLMQAEMEMEVAAVEKKYDKEIEAAQGNAYMTKQLEKKKQQEVKKIKDEANRKMYAMEVMQAIAQTASAAINAYASAAAIPLVGYIIAPIAAAMALAAGMVQVAAIKKQQQQSATEGYSEGGFTKSGRVDEVAGVVHAGEWVASQKLLASPVARPLIEALDYAQRTNTIGSLKQADVSRSITAPAANANLQPQIIVQENAELREAIKRLNARLDEPFVTVNTVTGDLGIKQAQDSYQRLINNKSPKSKRK
ncbi:MAG: phage tail tape measure protein [Muribaculaceae bacterium]|nr:phage tail tape measure protein [Muribaculaceae bacterium]